MKQVNIGMILIAACALAGCATASTLPAEKIAGPEGSAKAAAEIGANQVPEARLHLQLAEQQMDLARSLLKQGDKERAMRMLRRAEADADLAIALTKQRAAQVQALEAINQVQQLKQMAR